MILRSLFVCLPIAILILQSPGTHTTNSSFIADSLATNIHMSHTVGSGLPELGRDGKKEF